MSLGSIPLPRRVSDAQFVGDLFGLFKRHRIETGEAGSFAQFETLLASKDTFRSQLFTLCTAISHMADADLSGEQLLDLISRALDDPEMGVPEGARKAFLSGYDAWSNRHLDADDTWPPVRDSAPGNGPIPFPQPAEDLSEPATPATRTPAARPPGMRTVQEALLMAKKEAAFELPPRAAAPPGTGVEGLTISELTKLLEDIEHRMSRIKPHMGQLNGLVHSPAESPERMVRARDFSESSKAAAAAQLRPSLVAPSAPPSSLTMEEATLIGETAGSDLIVEDKFLARHAYLNSTRRVPPAAPLELRRVVTTGVAAPSVYIPPPLVASAAPVGAASPVVFAVPESAMIAAAVAPSSMSASVGPTVAGSLPPKGAIVDHSANFPIAVVYKTETFRLYFHIAVGVFAAFLMVGCPLAGVVLFRSLHPVHRYVYHDLAPAIQTDADGVNDAPDATAPPAVGKSSELPAAAPWGSVAGNPDGTRAANHAQSSHGTGSAYPAKRKSSAGVWSPPPPPVNQ